MEAPTAPTTNIDYFAAKIYEQCDNLERFGRVEEAAKIRAATKDACGWEPQKTEG